MARRGIGFSVSAAPVRGIIVMTELGSFKGSLGVVFGSRPFKEYETGL
jgi:hypothetical protein